MKSIKKRILSVFTAAALAVGSLCLPDIGVLPSLVVPASADGVSYNYDPNTNTLTISGTGTINRADIIGYANHATTISIGSGITANGRTARHSQSLQKARPTLSISVLKPTPTTTRPTRATALAGIALFTARKRKNK